MLQPGIVLQNRYRIVQQIGAGGMGAVYEAVDERFGSTVALKQLLLPPSASPSQIKAFDKAFQREATLLHQLRHPSLPRVSDFFSDSTGSFLVMDYIAGPDMAELLAQRGQPFTLAEVLPWIYQVLDVLEYLHSQPSPVIHRDLKPHNLKLLPDGRVMLLDFGLSKALAPQAAGKSQSIVAFTLDYAPLEQIQGSATDARGDLFSLGMVIHHLLNGQASTQLQCDAVSRSVALAGQRPDPLRWPAHVPAALTHVLQQLVALAAAQRPASAAATRDLLRKSYNPNPHLSTIEVPPRHGVVAPTLVATPPAPATRRGTTKFQWIGISLALLLLLIAAFRWGALSADPPGEPSSVAGASADGGTNSATPAPPSATPVPPSATPAPPSATPVPPSVTPVPLASSVIPEMVEVPAGSFKIGSARSDANASDDERPQQTRDLPTYWIGKTEVTNAQFRPFVAGDGYTNPAYWTDAGWTWRTAQKRTQPAYWNDAQWNGDAQPVVGVSWYEAYAYTRWLSAQTGQDFRLPTEAEWEKAARGSDGRIYPWGNSWDTQRANSGESGFGKTTPVGSYPSGASPYGALDIAGNVWEWTASLYAPYPYNPSDGREDVANPANKFFTLRGGSWGLVPINLRAACRHYSHPSHAAQYIGVRLARHP